MSIDPEMAGKLAELKKQLEEVTGREIDASPEQLAIFAFPVGSAFYAAADESAEVLWRRIIFPGKFCVTPVRLLEASGRSTTGSDGKSTHEPPSQPTEMWVGGCEIDFVVNLEFPARPVVGHRISQAQPAIRRVTRKRLVFHIYIVAVELMQPHFAGKVGAGANSTPPHHVVDIEPQRALDRRAAATPSAAKSAHLGRSNFPKSTV